jgi:Flp pilus assembly protein TadD
MESFFKETTMPDLDSEKIATFKKGELRLAELLGMDAKQVAALVLMSHTQFMQGQLQKAQSILEGLIVLDPSNAYAHGLLGAIYQKKEDSRMAVAHYSQALTLFPDDIDSLVNRGEIYLKTGLFQEAALDLKKAISLDPDRKHPAANRGRLLMMTTWEALVTAKQNQKPD